MAKPLKFHQTLNQAPRSAKHGQYRRAGAPAHSSPIIGTDNGAGGADAGSVPVLTVYNPRSGAYTNYTGVGAGVTITTDQWIEMIAPVLERLNKPPEIPYAGVQVGEIIAWRAWLVVDEHHLRSLAHHYIWEPGATITGNINEVVDDDPFSISRIWGGVYAHRTRELTEDDTRESQMLDWPKREAHRPNLWIDWNAASDAYTVITYLGLVIGSVKLWGEVVEHERGYRAQFAKIVSLDAAWGVVDMDLLRAKYLQR